MRKVMDTPRNVGGFQLGITFSFYMLLAVYFFGINNHVHILYTVSFYIRLLVVELSSISTYAMTLVTHVRSVTPFKETTFCQQERQHPKSRQP